MLSDFWTAMIGGATRFDQPMVFDFSKRTKTSKCYPKKTIKFFLDSIHFTATDEMGLLDILLVLDFLNSEGRQDSEFEQDMAKRLIEDLKKMSFSVETQLLIVLFMKNFDKQDEDYVQFVKSHLNSANFNTSIFKFDPKNAIHTDVVDYMGKNQMYKIMSDSYEIDIEFGLMQIGKSLLSGEDTQ